MKRITKIALLITAIPASLILIVAVAALSVRIGALDRYALEALKNWAATSGITLEVEKFQLDPFVPSVRITKLVARGPEDSWVADCPDIYASLKPLASLAGDLTFSLLAEKPRIKGAMPKMASPGGEVQPKSTFRLSDITVERIRITEGSVDLAFPDSDTRLVLAGVNVDWLEKRGKGGLSGGSVTWKGETEEIQGATFEGEKAGAETRIESLIVKTTRAALTGGVRIGVFDSLSGEFNLRVDLRDLPEKWLAVVGLEDKRPVGGLIEVLGQVGGSLDSPTLNSVVGLTDGTFGSIKVSGLNANLDLTGKNLNIKKLSAKTSAGNVRDLKGSLDWVQGVQVKTDLELENFDLRSFMEPLTEGRFAVGLFGTGKLTAKGALSPALDLECRGKALAIRDFDVTTRTEEGLTTWYGLKTATLDVTARIGPQKIEFTKSRIDGGSVSVDIPAGEVEYATGLNFETDFSVKSLETVRQYLPEGFDAAFTAKGKLGGPYRALKFDYDLDVAESKIFGQPLGKISGHANYDLTTLKLGKVRLTSHLGEAEVDGTIGLTREGEYDLTTALMNGNIAEFKTFIAATINNAKIPSFGGNFSLAGRLNGKLQSPVFDGNIAVREFSSPTIGEFKGVKGLDLSAEGSFAKDSWNARKLSINLGQTLIEGGAEADLERFRTKGNITSLKLEDISKYVDQPINISGVFNGSFTAEGPYAQPVATLSGLVESLNVQSIPVGNLNATLGADSKGYSVSLELADRTAKIDAYLNKEMSLTAQLNLERFPWSSVPEKYRVNGIDPGTITGKANIEGQLGQEPAFRLKKAGWQGVLSSLVVGSQPLGEAHLTLSYPEKPKTLLRAEVAIWEKRAKATLLVDPITLESPEFLLELADLELTRIPGMPKEVRKGTIDLEAKVAMLQLPPKSRELKAILQEISKASISGSLAGAEIKGYPRTLNSGFTIYGNPREWTLETELPPLSTVKAKIELEELAWNISATLGDCDPAEFIPALEKKLKCAFNGQLEARGKVEKLEDFTASGEVKGIQAFGIGPVDGRWRLATQEWGVGRNSGVNFEVELPGAVSVEGLWLSESGTVSLNLAMVNTPVETWFPNNLKDKGYFGVIDANAEVVVEKSGEFTGQAKVAKLDVTTPKGRVENSGEMLVTFDRGKVYFEKVALLYEGLEWYISGNVKPGESYDAKGKVSLNLQKFLKNIPHVESISGMALFEASVVGPWASPKVTGVLEIGDGAEVKIDKLIYPFTKISAHAELSIPGDLRIEEISANFGEGAIHAEGRVILKDFMPDRLELFVETRNIHYEYPRGATYDFDGDFMITGPLKQVEVRGEARIKNFLHSKTIMWRTATLALAESAKKSRVGARETGDIYIDIAVLGDRNLKIENNIANLDLAADLRVKGYLPSPEILGRLDVNSGTVRFRGREYKLLRSNIEFMGNVGPFAVLDGRATTTIGEYTVNVSATGPLEDIKVDMSSVPALPRTDIVALLALGTTSENLENSEVITAFEATNILTGSIQDELEGQAYNVFGIDQFQINPTYSKSRQTTVPALTVGKAISSSLFARYSTELGVSAQQEVALEYLLKPGVIFMGSWNDQGTEARGSFGGEIRFRYTFR